MELNIPEQKMEPKAPPVAKLVKEKEAFKAPSLASLGVSQEASGIIEGAKMANPPMKVFNSEQDVFVELDKRDEQQIMGTSMEEFVYEFCPRHRWPGGARPMECQCKDTVLDLSWAGIAEVSRKMQITVIPGTTWLWLNSEGAVTGSHGQQEKDPGVLMMEFPDRIQAMVRAQDPKTLAIRVGLASSKKKIEFRNGGSKEDEFYAQKALSKAERNVLRQLIPQVVIKSSIKSFLETKYGSASKTKAGGVAPQAKESSLKQVQDIAEANGIEVSMDQLKAKIANEKTAEYCIGEIKKGRLKEFATFMGLGEAIIIDQDSQEDNLNGHDQ